MAPSLLPVVRVSSGNEVNTRFPGLQDVWTRTDALLKLFAFGAGFENGQMIITHQKREVGVSCVQFDDYLVFTVRFNAGNRIQIWFGSRF